jgi:hypothetical protein
VLRRLFAQGTPAAAVRQLYGGFFTAAVLSMVVGAVHYASFCSSKRLAIEATNGNGQAAKGAAAAASSSGHGHGGDVDNTGANLFAATVGAIATALVESPAELLRHQAQAGLPVDEILNSFKRGPSAAMTALYGGSFIPFLIESFPYDLCVSAPPSPRVQPAWPGRTCPGLAWPGRTPRVPAAAAAAGPALACWSAVPACLPWLGSSRPGAGGSPGGLADWRTPPLLLPAGAGRVRGPG